MSSGDDEHHGAGECPVVQTARIVSGKWTLLVLRDLETGPRRFTQIERSLAGISPRTLSQRLRVLEQEGIIAREVYCETPPRVEYRLTCKGEHLLPIVAAMRTWGERWGSTPGAQDPVAKPLPAGAHA